MYCNAACKKRHRHKHKKDCKEHLKQAAERAAKLHDEQLFKQPPPQFEDCPICFLRMPYLDSGRTYMSCCGKVLCTGCIYAVQSRATKEEHDVCPFCRTPPPTYEEKLIKRYEKRMELNDAEAIYSMGCDYSEGHYLPQNHAKALELFHRAGELGNSEAYYNIGYAYRNGEGVERDDTKATHYYELAAIKGDPYARNTLGVIEGKAGNHERALKHFLIAVKDGHDKSLKTIKGMCMHGDATKDDYIKALQARRAYLDEIKSDQRDEAAACDDDDDCKYY